MVPNTSHRLSVFVPTQLREKLERAALENDRSLSAEIRVRLRATTSEPSGAGLAPSPASPFPASKGEGEEKS